jgi:CDP-glucose 4,6-dehydratase
MKYPLGEQLKSLHGPILVTGHTGFKGTWLTLMLEALQIPVVGLSLPPVKNSLYVNCNRQDAIPEIYGDIRSHETVLSAFKDYQPSAVIHMAAQPLVLESYKTPVETFETNVMGTVNILDASTKNFHTKSVICVTTDKVYKNIETRKRFSENDPLSGKDPYSASKVGSEAAISAWQQISRVTNGIPIVSVRAGNVIGGGDSSEDRLLPDIVRSFISNTSPVLRNPSSTRPWQHALDPLIGYLQALEFSLSNTSSSSYNFGPDEESLSVCNVAKIALNAWNDSDLTIFESENEISNFESLTLELDSSLAARELNWSPLWTQEEAIRSTLLWWKSVQSKQKSPLEACSEEILKAIETTNHKDH